MPHSLEYNNNNKAMLNNNNNNIAKITTTTTTTTIADFSPVTRIVRLKAPDYSTDRHILKEYLVYYEN